MAKNSEDVRRVIEDYRSWIETQHLSANTRRSYATQVSRFGQYLIDRPGDRPDHPLRDTHARDVVVRDYKYFLKTSRHLEPSTINLALAALDHFYVYLGLDKVGVSRDELPLRPLKVLDTRERQILLRAIERTVSVRDQAIMMLLLYTGIRVSEAAQLDLNDVAISTGKGLVTVRSGDGDSHRELPLNAPLREILMAWVQTRMDQHSDSSDTAFFLNRWGHRLTARGISMIVENIGKQAGLEISPRMLRNTCLANLLRNGNNLVLVAQIAGHQRLESILRYCQPPEDRALAMENLRIGF